MPLPCLYTVNRNQLRELEKEKAILTINIFYFSATRNMRLKNRHFQSYKVSQCFVYIF